MKNLLGWLLIINALALFVAGVIVLLHHLLVSLPFWIVGIAFLNVMAVLFWSISWLVDKELDDE